jgi:hypothetical protein
VELVARCIRPWGRVDRLIFAGVVALAAGNLLLNVAQVWNP